MKLCYGSFLKVLRYGARNSVNQKEMCTVLFFVCNDRFDVSNDSTTVSRMIHCKRNVPADVRKSISKNFDALKMDFDARVMPLLDDRKLKRIISAILEIIRQDNTIDSETIIMENKKLSKREILKQTIFSPTEFLVEILLYVISKVKNKDGEETIDSVNEQFFNLMKDRENRVMLESDMSNEIILTKTLHVSDFKDIFIDVKHNSNLVLPNPCQIQAFSMEIKNSRFSYLALREFIRLNIGRYLFSRAQIDNAVKEGRTEEIVQRAIDVFRISSEKHTGQFKLEKFLIYVFLEQCLGAPKIILNPGLQNSAAGLLIHSDSIHLFQLQQQHSQFDFQIVFGIGTIARSIDDAIQILFNRIGYILKHKESELASIKRAITEKQFDDFTSHKLKQIVIPGKNKDYYVDDAFGLFIGYPIHLKKICSNNIFRKESQTHLEKDIEYISRQLTKKIQENNLSNYSFYVYVMPFNDDIWRENM